MSIYIEPLIKIFSNYELAREFFNENNAFYIENREKQLSMPELVQGKRNLIVGEPGIGKTLFLEKISEYISENGFKTKLLKLKNDKVIKEIGDFLDQHSSISCYLLLDALDEVPSNTLMSILEKIEQISEQYPEISIYISSRWIFINRYFKYFTQYRIISILPFSYQQVEQYLLNTEHSPRDVDKLLKLMLFGHHNCLVQIPRYLNYLNDFIKDKGITAASQVSRNELFEYFIYHKLDKEEEKRQTNKKSLIKRMLEMIALVMEIYQKNVITKDELMTIFDDIKSDLKLVALSQIELETFFDASLLKSNFNSIEFENTEIQEYLAAKEITRFPDPHLAAFSFSTSTDAQEIYPTWYNALTFLVDINPSILEQLIEFSKIRSVETNLVQSDFFTFLSRINPNNLSIEFKQQIFKDVFNYHQRTLQLLPNDLASSLSNFFDRSLENILINEISEDGVLKKDTAVIGNILYIVSYLIKNESPINREFWKSKLMIYVMKDIDQGILQRFSLLGLKWLKDASIINQLPNLMKSSEKIVIDEFLSACVTLDSDHSKTVKYLIEAIKTISYVDMRFFLKMEKRASVKKICNEFIFYDRFRINFLSYLDLFRDEINLFVKKLQGNINGSLVNFFTRILLKSIQCHEISTQERIDFFIGIWNILRNQDSRFIHNFLKALKDEAGNVFCIRDFLPMVLRLEDVEIFIHTLIELEDKFFALSILWDIKLSRNSLKNEIYEAGRSVLPEDYILWENGRSLEKNTNLLIQKQNEEYIKEFRKFLEPAPNSYSPYVFQFYNNNKDHLSSLMIESDYNRLSNLVEIILSKDSSNFIVKINHETKNSKNISMSGEIPLFKEAILTARYLKLDFSPFRQNLINFIPYLDSSKDLENIFEIIGNIVPEETKQVLSIYIHRDSDTWQYHPDNLITLIERYYFIDAVPILKELIREQRCGMYFRERALKIIDSLSADPSFLKDIFASYKNQPDDQELANVANGLLITIYKDEAAIKWRLNQVAERVSQFIDSSGVHEVSSIEREIRFSPSFAEPLMQLCCQNYLSEYLELLEKAITIYSQGQEFYAYVDYLFRIVFSYLENLKERETYNPLFKLEEKIIEIGYTYKIFSLNYLITNLRRSYLISLCPKNISQAIKNYNNARNFDDKQILNSKNLLEHLLDGLEVDVRRWIEGEGAYNLILGEKVFKAKKQEYETLIQKTIKTQIENIFLKRGFQIRLERESQLIDAKRVDFLVWYGFVGPILIEVKLMSSSDMNRSNIDQTKSFKSMQRYMDGYGAAFGILLLIINKESDNIQIINEAFEKIENVYVKSFSIFSLKPNKPKKAKIAPENSQVVIE